VRKKTVESEKQPASLFIFFPAKNDHWPPTFLQLLLDEEFVYFFRL
jgi:hypothetical protein